MLKQIQTVFLAMSILLITNGAYATIITYTVKYAKDSKYTALSLKNATLRIQLYVNGTPQDILIKQTNANQTFALDNKFGDRLVVEVMSIKGEPKNISCHGTAQHDKIEILINCHPRYGKKHFY